MKMEPGLVADNLAKRIIRAKDDEEFERIFAWQITRLVKHVRGKVAAVEAEMKGNAA